MSQSHKWSLISGLFAGLAFLDLCILTWYLVGIPDSHFDILEKRLGIIGSWFVSIAAYLGIKKWKLSDTPSQVFGSRLIQIIVGILTVLCLFLIAPLYGIEFKSNPAGATIHIEGEKGDRGKTPQKVEGLSSRIYDVSFEKEGYKKVIRTVSFMEVLKHKKISINLEPETGSLSVETTPEGVNIYVKDMNRRGLLTPQTLEDIPVGSYTLILKKDGYDPVSKQIKIRPEQATPVHVSMSQEYQPHSPLTILSDPPGAKIWVDDRFYGTTNVTVPLPAGTHNIFLKKDGKVKRDKVSIPQQDTVSYTID